MRSGTIGFYVSAIFVVLLFAFWPTTSKQGTFSVTCKQDANFCQAAFTNLLAEANNDIDATIAVSNGKALIEQDVLEVVDALISYYEQIKDRLSQNDTTSFSHDLSELRQARDSWVKYQKDTLGVRRIKTLRFIEKANAYLILNLPDNATISKTISTSNKNGQEKARSFILVKRLPKLLRHDNK
ncbi:MAG: hypothetical protein V1838_00075 [Patescibacteria group bacterium]